MPWLWHAWLSRTVVALAMLCLQSSYAQGVWWVDGALEQQPLQAAVSWCMDTTAQLDVQAVSRGACPLKPAQKFSLTPGLRSGSMWLRLQLGNASAQPMLRWLVVGHPQLQRVTLWLPTSETDPTQGWQATYAGTSVPRLQRAVTASYPVLPVTLAAHSVQTLYLQVTSQTHIDANVALWDPYAFDLKQGATDLLGAMALGGLLLAALFSLLIFITNRQRIYLFFFLSVIGAIVLETCKSGLLADHFWPPDRPFPDQIMPIGFAISTLFLTLFSLEYLDSIKRRHWLVNFVKSALVATMLGTLWAVLVNLKQGTLIASISLVFLMACTLGLLLMRYREGQHNSIYLLITMMPPGLTQVLTFAMVMGWLPTSAGFVMISPVVFLAITPLLLLSLFQHYARMQNTLISSQAINAARAGFLTQMSHDLRAPLSVIVGYSRTLRRSSSNLTAEDAAIAIDHASQHLLGMIDEILEYSQGQVNKLLADPTPVHWPTLVQELTDYGAKLAKQNSNLFVLCDKTENLANGDAVAELSDLFLDERRLRRVLDNLLVNACRYTHSGRVTLTCKMALQTEHTASLLFEVADTGAGITLEEQKVIFEPFVRGVAGKQSDAQGSGLGLAIARQLTELMGGTLSLQSEPGRGSRFALRLTCPTATVTATKADVACPAVVPPRLDELQRLIAQGDVTGILEWADVLAQSQPDYLEYASKIRDAAMKVDFAALRRYARRD